VTSAHRPVFTGALVLALLAGAPASWAQAPAEPVIPEAILTAPVEVDGVVLFPSPRGNVLPG
jgi:hypothetical protein